MSVNHYAHYKSGGDMGSIVIFATVGGMLLFAGVLITTLLIIVTYTP
jgi:hypothetical protein